MRITYGVCVLIFYGLAYIFIKMTMLPWATDIAFGYVLAGLFTLAGTMSLVSTIKGSK